MQVDHCMSVMHAALCRVKYVLHVIRGWQSYTTELALYVIQSHRILFIPRKKAPRPIFKASVAFFVATNREKWYTFDTGRRVQAFVTKRSLSRCNRGIKVAGAYVSLKTSCNRHPWLSWYTSWTPTSQFCWWTYLSGKPIASPVRHW